MEHILRKQMNVEDDESVYSKDYRFAEVYSNDQESVLSNGQFKALGSEEYSRKGHYDDGDSEEKDESTLLDEEERDENGLNRCESGDVQSNNVCLNWFMEMLYIVPKELIIKVLAFSIPSSTKILQTCCEEVPLPGSPGVVFVGRVMTKTPHYCEIQMNDRVMVVLPVGKDVGLETFTYANIPFKSVIKVSKTLNPMTQVSLLFTYLPALQILQSLPFQVKHKKVILNGGVGPVIRSLVHLCILHGAKKIYVPCEKKHRDDVRRIGGKTAGPNHFDWGPTYLDEIDLVVDAIGENSYVTSRAVLNETGHLCVIGNTDSTLKGDNVFNNLSKMVLDYRVANDKRTSVFNLMATIDNDRESFVQDFEYLCSLMDDGRIDPMFTKMALDEYRNAEGSDTATMLNAPLICDPWSEYRWG